jgi:hypothetical protein
MRAVPKDTGCCGCCAVPGIREAFDALNRQWAAVGVIGPARQVPTWPAVGEGGAVTVAGRDSVQGALGDRGCPRQWGRRPPAALRPQSGPVP